MFYNDWNPPFKCLGEEKQSQGRPNVLVTFLDTLQLEWTDLVIHFPNTLYFHMHNPNWILKNIASWEVIKKLQL